jgi:uncharacterized protein GlcG (DUF336 family)
MRTFLLAIGIAMLLASLPAPVSADDDRRADCRGLPSANQLRQLLRDAAVTGPGPVGGLFGGTRMWGAVVNRDGEICVYVTSTANPTQVWPGSQAIAKAKAYTANAFSLDVTVGPPATFPLSTARLYTFTQPGHSLNSLGQSNLWNPKFNAPPGGQGGGRHDIAGGLIFFGGGVALYQGSRVIGGLGVSGDTACADHEMAKRVRDLAGLTPPGGSAVDDITYSSTEGPTVFTHPLCPNTFRNGVFVGTEPPATGY